MYCKFAAVLFVGAAVAASSVNAEESVSVLGVLPAATCANAAATANRTGVSISHGVTLCDEAVKDAALTRSELAATYVNRSALHLADGNYAAAISDSNAALRTQSDMVEALINRGNAFAAQKQYANAVDDFSHAMAMAPANPALLYFNRGLVREDAGDLKGAYLDYQQAAELDPNWDKPKHELVRFTVVKSGR